MTEPVSEEAVGETKAWTTHHDKWSDTDGIFAPNGRWYYFDAPDDVAALLRDLNALEEELKQLRTKAGLAVRLYRAADALDDCLLEFCLSTDGAAACSEHLDTLEKLLDEAKPLIGRTPS